MNPILDKNWILVGLVKRLKISLILNLDILMWKC